MRQRLESLFDPETLTLIETLGVVTKNTVPHTSLHLLLHPRVLTEDTTYMINTESNK